MGLAYWLVAKDFDAAIRELEEARRINPGDAQVQHAIGRTLLAWGRADEALPYLQEAVRLSPSDMMFGIFCAGLAYAYLSLKQYEKAVEWGRYAIGKLPSQADLWQELLHLPAALAYLKRYQEAGTALEELLAMRPGLSIEAIREQTVFLYQEYLEHLLEGLLKAGLK